MRTHGRRAVPGSDLRLPFGNFFIISNVSFLLTFLPRFLLPKKKKNNPGDKKEHKPQPDKWSAWEEKKFFSALKVRLDANCLEPFNPCSTRRGLVSRHTECITPAVTPATSTDSPLFPHKAKTLLDFLFSPSFFFSPHPLRLR